jgi:16S rRNA pseudouridine516 synthase
MKLERILQTQGFGSRRECRSLIRAGLVEIEGEIIEDPFAEFDPEGMEFVVDGEVWPWHEHVYLMLHKPLDYECSRQPQHHRSIFELLPPQFALRDVQPVGRLDVDTTGLLLLSDDGQFIHTWSSGKKRIPKLYEVGLRHPVNDVLLAALREGVQLHDEPAPIRARRCDATGESAIDLVVTEGKYHQVRRMIGAAGNRVEVLHRRAVGGLELPADLVAGDWRWMSEDDLRALANFDPA